MSFTAGCPHGAAGASSPCPCKSIHLRSSIFTASEWGVVADVEKRAREEGGATRTDAYGYTALHFAAQHGHARVAEVLMDAGAEVDACKCGATPLHRACFAGHEHVAQLLMDRGANPAARDTTAAGAGDTPAHKAARQKHGRLVQVLVERCPQVRDAVNKEGLTPMQLLVMEEQKCQETLATEDESKPPGKGQHGVQKISSETRHGAPCGMCGAHSFRMTRSKISGQLVCPPCGKRKCG